MNSAGISTSPAASTLLDPQALLGDVKDAKSEAIKALQKSFHLLGSVSTSEAAKTSDIVKDSGLTELEKPTTSKDINDITLRIGLLQDALNQLMEKVSRSEIKQRMNQMQNENKQQLEKFKEQMEKAAEAAEKNKEAQKKGNVFEAISNWIQAVVSIVSAVFTFVAAVGEIFTNPAGAVGLFAAGVALVGAAAVQITLAVDATMRATGHEGFLSDADKQKMQKAVEILGYIALAGSMIGLVGGVVVALGQAGKAAATLTGEQVGRFAAAKLATTGTKEILKGSMDMTVSRVAKYAFDDAMENLLKYSARAGLSAVVGKGGTAIASGVVSEKIADIKQEASDLKAEADRAEAEAKAMAAQIAKIRALIEQLQQELEAMIEQGQQTMSVIFGSIEQAGKAMTEIHQAGRPA
ncbi:hypothetical protein DB347_06215 [Opitutaceae bacterium EW11]|nr:hypothetical protein DB347_06215 [Opitutaceae bacterium EW11]